jgi:acylphosphatase
MKRGAKFTVQGTVQGIFFRQFVKENADKLNVTGFVRNLENGTVEIVAEGELEKVNELGTLLKKGPEHSQIRNVVFEEKKWSGEFKDFKILRI